MDNVDNLPILGPCRLAAESYPRLGSPCLSAQCVRNAGTKEFIYAGAGARAWEGEGDFDLLYASRGFETSVSRVN